MSKRVEYPTFELVSCPTIKIADLKEAIKMGTIRGLQITDTVTGETTTVGASLDRLERTFEAIGVKPPEDSVLGKMVADLKKHDTSN